MISRTDWKIRKKRIIVSSIGSLSRNCWLAYARGDEGFGAVEVVFEVYYEFVGVVVD